MNLYRLDVVYRKFLTIFLQKIFHVGSIEYSENAAPGEIAATAVQYKMLRVYNRFKMSRTRR